MILFTTAWGIAVAPFDWHLEQLPRDRVIAALDALDGEVVVEGWRAGTGRNVLTV